MAVNSVEAVLWRAVVLDQIDTEAWQFLAVCLPIVVFGAPFGSVLGSYFHRQVLAASLYIITTASLISAFAIVKQTVTLGAVAGGVMLCSCSIFVLLTIAGKHLLKYIDEEQSKSKDITISTIVEMDISKLGRGLSIPSFELLSKLPRFAYNGQNARISSSSLSRIRSLCTHSLILYCIFKT